MTPVTRVTPMTAWIWIRRSFEPLDTFGHWHVLYLYCIVVYVYVYVCCQFSELSST